MQSTPIRVLYAVFNLAFLAWTGVLLGAFVDAQIGSQFPFLAVALLVTIAVPFLYTWLSSRCPIEFSLRSLLKLLIACTNVSLIAGTESSSTAISRTLRINEPSEFATVAQIVAAISVISACVVYGIMWKHSYPNFPQFFDTPRQAERATGG